MAPEVAPAPAPLAADDTDLSSAVSAAAAQAPSLPDDSAQLASQVADSKAPAPAPAEEAAAPTLAPAPAPGSASGLTAFGGAQDPSKAQVGIALIHTESASHILPLKITLACIISCWLYPPFFFNSCLVCELSPSGLPTQGSGRECDSAHVQ